MVITLLLSILTIELFEKHSCLNVTDLKQIKRCNITCVPHLHVAVHEDDGEPHTVRVVSSAPHQGHYPREALHLQVDPEVKAAPTVVGVGEAGGDLDLDLGHVVRQSDGLLIEPEGEADIFGEGDVEVGRLQCLVPCVLPVDGSQGDAR